MPETSVRTTTPNLKLPLPSADFGEQVSDIQRISQALIKVDEALDDAEILTIALGS